MRRRTFIRSASAGGAMLALGALRPSAALAAAARGARGNSAIKGPGRADKFRLGIAGYTFRHFDIDCTLEVMRFLDLRYLCVKDFHLPLDSDAARIADFRRKLEASRVTGYAVGPIYMRSEADVERAFDYARRVGVPLLVGVPDHNLLDRAERAVREHGIRLAIHLHGPDMALYPDATDIWERVKGRDPRVGICLDIGHDLRCGSDPLADYVRYRSRVFDMHVKDVTAPAKEGARANVGRGIIDFPRLVRLLRRHGYDGSLSLEHEKEMDNPFMGIAESIGFLRGVMSAL